MTDAATAYDGTRAGRAGGSWSSDDPDRPRWDAQTETDAEYDYELPHREYAYTVRKGRNGEGEKVFAIARRNMIRFGDRLDPEDHRDWFPGMGEHPHLLYLLPELIAASHDCPVFIGEGEKDAQRLADEGLIATTGSCGARKWRREFSEYLAGRDVVILPDNDEVGREHAAVVLRSVHPLARSVKVLELPALAPKGDVSDWLDAGNTVADLMTLVADEPKVSDPGAWAAARGQFAADKDGKPYPSIPNAETSLHKIGVRVSFDEFAGRYLLDGLPGFGPVLDDAALTHMRLLTERKFRLQYGKDRWGDIVTDYARRNKHHPVRDYLDGLKWDCIERLDRWLIEYGGAEDCEYVRAVGAIVLMAAVRRVRQPGCKFDEMLVLESAQGTGKSSALAVLAVREEWFADDLPLDSDSKIVMERTAGRWLIELAELKGMKRGEVEHAKAMISRQVDKARLAYARLTTEQPRQCVFFGTTNDSHYLRDMTGNRRFWPVRVGQFDLEGLRRDRDQLWAEAAMREARGDSIRLPERLWLAAAEQQAGRLLEDPFYEILAERLEGIDAGKASVSDVWEAVGLGPGDEGRRNQDMGLRLSNVMQALGWRRAKSTLRIGRKVCKAWIKGEPGLAVDAYPEVPRDVLIPPEAM